MFPLKRLISTGVLGVATWSVYNSVVVAQVADCKAENEHQARNSAFVFLKPHANTPAAQKIVEANFAKRGIHIQKEGELTAEKIDEDMLIDQHYYAIASKATLLKVCAAVDACIYMRVCLVACMACMACVHVCDMCVAARP